MTHATCRLTAKILDQLRNATLGNRVWATFTFSKGTLVECIGIYGVGDLCMWVDMGTNFTAGVHLYCTELQCRRPTLPLSLVWVRIVLVDIKVGARHVM